MLTSNLQISDLKGSIRGNRLKFLNSNFGDWFVLHQVYKNIQHTNFAQLVSKLCGTTRPPLRRNETHIFYNVNEPDNEVVEEASNDFTDAEKHNWSIQQQLQEQQKHKFDVGSNSSLGTVVPS